MRKGRLGYPRTPAGDPGTGGKVPLAKITGGLVRQPSSDRISYFLLTIKILDNRVVCHKAKYRS
jgi:hypothetical protein